MRKAWLTLRYGELLWVAEEDEKLDLPREMDDATHIESKASQRNERRNVIERVLDEVSPNEPSREEKILVYCMPLLRTTTRAVRFGLLLIQAEGGIFERIGWFD
jgi:hypothetical protein